MMNLPERYAQALQLAADLAADHTELLGRYEALLIDYYQAAADRDTNHQAVIDARAEIERLTHERDEARKGWADAIRSRTNSSIGNGIVIGPTQE